MVIIKAIPGSVLTILLNLGPNGWPGARDELQGNSLELWGPDKGPLWFKSQMLSTLISPYMPMSP